MERMWRGSVAVRSERSRRGRRIVAVVAIAAPLLTGCLGGEVDVRVDDDGSGRIEAEVLLDPATSSALEQVDVSALVGQLDTTSEVEIESISQRGLDGYRIVVPFDDVDSLSTVLTQGVDVAGARVRLMESLSITNDPADGSWTMDAVVLPASQVVEPLRSSGLPGFDQGQVGLNDLSLSVALPGEVVRTNAPSSDDGTATWPLDQYQVPAGLQMRNEPSTFPTPLQLVLGGALAVVLFGVVLALWGATAAARRRATRGRPRARRRSRRNRAAAGAGRGGWGPGGGTADAWGTTRGTALPPLQDGEQGPPPSDRPSPQD
jgi:hypothetical protein